MRDEKGEERAKKRQLSVEELAQRYRQRVERRTKALELRKNGMSFQSIANELGTSKIQAIRDVKAALAPHNRREREMATELRQGEAERLDMAVEAIRLQVKQGELRAVDRWINLSVRRTKLLGLERAADVVKDDKDDRSVTIRVEYVNAEDADA